MERMFQMLFNVINDVSEFVSNPKHIHLKGGTGNK